MRLLEGRKALDTVTGLAIIVACVAVTWSAVHDIGFRRAIARASVQTASREGRGDVTRRESALSGPVVLQDAAYLGEPAARVVLIEYSDFSCPYCGEFARTILPQLRQQYIDTGRVLLAFQHLPLTKLHAQAFKAAAAAECARRQGKFWRLHDVLFALPPNEVERLLMSAASQAGLDESAFQSCVRNDAAAVIDDSIERAKLLKIVGTPTFLIGLTDDGVKVNVKVRLSGARSLSEFAAVLDRLLE